MDSTIATRTMSKITWRFLPLLFACFVIAFLDRVNIGFAALTMNADLKFSASVYGLGAGLFFLTYVALEVPSNLALERYGARRWIARIMLTWGVISAATAFISGPGSFYVMRLMLGAAEAGFFPGIIFFLGSWVPSDYRGRFIGAFMAAMPVASIIGGPVSGLLLGLDGVMGLRGWQWLFIIEAIPAIAFAPVVLLILRDKPAEASWLTPDERSWLSDALQAEPQRSSGQQHASIWKSLRRPKLFALAIAWFGFTGINYGLSFFLPQIIAAFGLSHVATGFLSAVPFIIATVAMVLVGARSDRIGERRLHICIPTAIAVGSLLGAAFPQTLLLKLVFLCVASAGIFSALPLFWALVPGILSGETAAAGIALVNALGNLSGFCQPYIMGHFKDLYGGFAGGLISIAMFACIGIVIVWLLGRPSKDTKLARGEAMATSAAE